MTGEEGEPAVTAFRFQAQVIHWRGPSPFFFVPVPIKIAGDIGALARAVSYGWGMIPTEACIREVDFSTSLFPKDGAYLLPLKAAVRQRIGVTAGDRVDVRLTVRAARR